jgi:hypothetical protein
MFGWKLNINELFGWYLHIDELFGWNIWLIRCMDESNSKIVMMNENYWTHIIFMSNFVQKKGVKGEIQRNYITMQKGETITCVTS